MKICKQLKIYNNDETEPSACVLIVSKDTNETKKWNDASRDGWFGVWDTQSKAVSYWKNKPIFN